MIEGERDITALLQRWREGQAEAAGEVYQVLYKELRRQARACMRREAPDHALQTTELVHEVYVRLAAAECPAWRDRVHFLAVAARAMRRVLIDMARGRRATKRGGGVLHVPLDTSEALAVGPGVDVLALDRALDDLARIDPRKATGVELRFFGGLSNEEIANALDVSTDTVLRDWRMARAWLHRALTEHPRP